MPKYKKIEITVEDLQNQTQSEKSGSESEEETYETVKKFVKKTIDPMKLYNETMEWITQFQEDYYVQPVAKKYETLPWVEKYRPQTLGEILSHKEIIDTLKEFIKKRQVPHLLLYGPPGTGKTSTAMACARELYGDNYPLMVLEINASEERGIEVVRNKIKDFIITKGVFLTKNSSLFKVVILDEADAMTSDAQAMLRSVIERHTENVRFWLICNYVKKINPAIQSRCTPFKFSPLPISDIGVRLKEIGKKTNITVTDDGIEEIVKISRGDMRKVINILQSTSMIYDSVNKNTVAKCVGYPTCDDMEKIIHSLINDKMNACHEKVCDIISKNGYALLDIITELTDILVNKFIKNDKDINYNAFCNILKNLRDIEMNLTLCPNEGIQLAGIVATFKYALV